MDDMDKEAQELGGKASFFTNGYEKYAWTKIMDSKTKRAGSLEIFMLKPYPIKPKPHLPQLFRDIFKDAFLPYRDPETLNLFLKEINEFTYDHSEDLGDAFEYLLSILGSQGDAGQFRTPRHIIDFIVEAVDPQKEETVCDPSCGTAGFLISAFQHIISENKDKQLTPDERENLMNHFVGYDISPDMVRLSKVNMYLHHFPNPTIYEYDTLTSEEKNGTRILM
jgi:type I restriction enzyme M protein